MSGKRNLSMIEYFNRVSQKLHPRLRFAGSNRVDFEAWHGELLAEVKSMLGPMPAPAPLNAEIVWEAEQDGLIKRRIMLDTEEHMSVAVWLFIPPAAFHNPLPAIVCNHGHGNYGKDSVMGIRSNNDAEREAEIKLCNYDYGLKMAQHGYVTLAWDLRVFGERGDEGDPYAGRDKCNVHFIRGSLMGINLLALNVFDHMRMIDYLQGLDFVDADKIGAMGLSQGGTMTTWASLMDERIKAADIIGYSARFTNFAIERANFCGSQYVPGLFAVCDVPDLHGLIAPRPLLAEIGLYDKCFLAEESLSCAAEVKKIYAAAGVPENYEVDAFPGDHQFGDNKAFGFFDKHLKGVTSKT